MEADAMTRGLLAALLVFGMCMLYRYYLERTEKTTRLYFFERGKLAGLRRGLGVVRNMYVRALMAGESVNDYYYYRASSVVAWEIFSAFMDDLRCEALAGHSSGGAVRADAER